MAVLQADLAGAFALGELVGVLAAAAEEVSGDGGRLHVEGAESGAPVAVEAVAGDVPGVAAAEIQSVAAVPLDAVGGEHDGGAAVLAAEAMLAVAGELVVGDEAVPAVDLDSGGCGG